MTGGIDRREAIRRVVVALGAVTLVGGDTLLTACSRERPALQDGERIGDFTPEDVAFLDEVAETILPETETPGAKAARTGAFMALMVTDTYAPADQQTFRDGMRALDQASREVNGSAFIAATPQQRLALLEELDAEQKRHMEAREASRARRTAGEEVDAKEPEAYLPDQRQESAPAADAAAAPAITADAPAHYFRMMKELALLGYFTSEIGCTQAQRYVEAPGRFDPCVPYTPGERAWAPHA
ncbi:MAG TPA: gluconate 2-dehydrogenase subunit 3 family protein [Gemmatimonadaceae bacterium]|nr:gluconate 2-dehydrogenase subunit 3 family protein [Gemmatimonadaceae bacterium]